MVHSQNKILLIVEGAKTEPRVFERIEKVKWNESSSLDIVPIGTNIYSLYQTIEKLNADFNDDSTSTIEVLKQILKDNKRFDELPKLEQKYPYIYLLFDFEYQDNHFENKKEILLKMMNYFSDETDNGLLLINYPMIESYRDYKEPLPYKDYKELTIPVRVVKDLEYKSLVDKRGTAKNYSKYNLKDFELIFIQNLMKANYVANGMYEVPDYNEFIYLVEGKNILDGEFKYVDDKDEIAILCTSIFIFIYYFGKKYYSDVISKYNEVIMSFEN